jgi:hypothetical protein
MIMFYKKAIVFFMRALAGKENHFKELKML